jgi:hypothetical protein
MATVATAAVGLMADWNVLGFEWEWYLPLTVGGVAMAGAWLVLLNGHRRMLWMVETIVGQDLDDDGVYGQPPQPVLPAPARTVPVEVRRGDMGRTIQRDELPEPTAGALAMFMRECALGGTSFSERGATVYGYSREMWLALRERFLVQQWVVWRVPGSERQGVVFTAAGRAVMRGLAGTPLPQAGMAAISGATHARTHDARSQMTNNKGQMTNGTGPRPGHARAGNTSYLAQEDEDE